MTILGYGRSIRSKNYMTSLFRKLSTEKQEPILFETIGTAGVATLNRPKQLNALDYRIWELLLSQLKEWEKSRSHIIIKGAGDKAFCAGGDIKWLANIHREPSKFIFEKNFSNGLYLLSNYSIPYISLMDGITFGGGLTLAQHGRYRVATERTLLATPETQIGWLTDASATYLLPRLRNHLGFYMGLTGKRIKGEDAVIAGLATHFVSSTRLQELESKLSSCKADDVEAHINAYNEARGEFSLAFIIEDIDYCFSANTVEEIIERLENTNNSWSLETVNTLSRMCPTMLKVSLRAIQQGKNSNMKQCIVTENRVLSRVIGSYNAQEGMRALMVDKRQPIWEPSSLAEVTEDMVDSYFEPLPDGDLLFADDDKTILMPQSRRP